MEPAQLRCAGASSNYRDPELLIECVCVCIYIELLFCSWLQNNLFCSNFELG